MRFRLYLFGILILILVCLSSCDLLGNLLGLESQDYSSSAVLQSIPTVDVAEYDVSIDSSSARIVTAVEGNWSAGAGFSKSLRNKSIALSRKIDYLIQVVQVLDASFEEISLTDGTYYYKLKNVILDTLPGIFNNATARIISSNNETDIGIDLAIDGEVKLQIVATGYDSTLQTPAVVEAWFTEEFSDSTNWETLWIKLDISSVDLTVIQYKQLGSGSGQGNTNLDYFYQGTLTRDASGSIVKNTAEGAFLEDFTGDEDFGYQLGYFSCFNSDYGSTYAEQRHYRIDGQSDDSLDIYGPEAWDNSTNTVVLPSSSFETYFSEVSVEGEVVQFNNNGADFTVDRITETWFPEWDGVIPSNASAENLDMINIPDENVPHLESWDKYDDLTTFTNLANEDPATVFSTID